MSSKITSFNSRLRRLEKKARMKPLDFFAQQTDETLFAILEMPMDMADDDEPEYYATKLSWSAKHSESFTKELRRVCEALRGEFRQLSDEELSAIVSRPFEA